MKRFFIPILTFFGRRIERRRFTEAPIYIGGCGRSGTTLLLSILSAHPEIFACPRELNPFEGAARTSTGIETPKFYRLYRTFLTKKIKASASRYCEKSPANIRHVDLIDEFHQGHFRMIHIVRDGRDVILSKHPRKESGYWVDPKRWVEDVTCGLRYKEHPRVLTIKYEDLVMNFDTCIRQICEFLDLVLSDEILNWHKHATVRQNNALFATIQEINSNSVGKWKNTENKERVRKLTEDEEALDLLKKLNYIT